VHVSTRSPSPVRPASVSRRAPAAQARRAISARPRVMSPACAFRPRPRPSATPAAMAMTFFSAPPISTPTTSLVPYSRKYGARKSACTCSTTAVFADALGGAKLLLRDLGRSKQRVLLEALRGADDNRVGAHERRGPPQHVPHAVRWDGRHDYVHLVERLLEIRRDLQSGRERDVGEVDRVGAARAEVRDERGVASPQPRVVAGAYQVHGERGAPPAGAEYRDHRRSPIRRSVPAMSRDRLSRCRWTTRMAASVAPAATGAGTLLAAAATASVSAPAIEPAEMKRVTRTVATNTRAATAVASGASTANTPADA